MANCEAANGAGRVLWSVIRSHRGRRRRQVRAITRMLRPEKSREYHSGSCSAPPALWFISRPAYDRHALLRVREWKSFCMGKDPVARTWIDGRVIRRAIVAAICSLTFVGLGARSQDRVPEPAGYRVSDYRAPTPATLAGARVLTTAEAQLYWRNGEVFVDVLAHSPRPANLPNGTIWREKTAEGHSGQRLAA